MKALRFIPLLAVLGVALSVNVPVAAAGDVGPTDFSGTWVLNTSKGENLGMVAAIQETVTIVQTPNRMTIDFRSTFQGRDTLRQVGYDLDGVGVMNEGAMGDRGETVSEWKGDRLVTTWTTEGAVAGTTVKRTETRSLSGDGNEMTVETVRGERPPMILVYERRQ